MTNQGKQNFNGEDISSLILLSCVFNFLIVERSTDIFHAPSQFQHIHDVQILSFAISSIITST